MAVVIGEKTYEVVNGTYYLVATYGLAAQKSGMYPPSDIENKLLTKEYVSNTGCQIVSDPVLTYTPTMCVLYRDLEVDDDIMLDGDETVADYVFFCYTTTDNNILTPYPYDEDYVTWYEPADTIIAGYKFKDGIPIDPWYQENTYNRHTDSDGKVLYEGVIEKNANQIPSIAQGGVFQDCTTLKEITTCVNPDIGENCFKNCENLEKVIILGNDNNSSDVIIDNGAFMNCTQLKTVVFGSYWYDSMDDKVYIRENAFNGDVNLKHLQGQDNIKTIGNYAFKNCSGLTVLTLLNCNSIGDQAFENCTNITKIIVKGYATFGSNIFSGCTNIEEIIFLDDCTPGLTNMMTQLDAVAKSTLKVRVPNDYYNNYYNKLSGITTSKEWKSQLSNNKYQSYNDIVLCDYDNRRNDGVWNTAVAFGWLRYNTRHLTIYESETITNFPQIASSSVINDIFDKDCDRHAGNDGYSDNQGEHLLSFNQFKWFTGLRSVPEDAFKECINLSSVIIPNSATIIEDEAFYKCSSLTSVTIPNSITSIGDEVFYQCNSLESVTIGNSVTSLGYEVFYECTSLTSVTIPNSVINIGDEAFYKCYDMSSITISNNVTSIGKYTFYECTGLTSVTIPDSVESIGEEAFYQCDNLLSVTIGNSVTIIEDEAFYNCSSLTSVTIPDSVESIGDEAFYDCSSLESVTIGNGVTEIEDEVFGRCSGLTSIIVDNGNTVYDSRNDCNAIIETATNILIAGCKNTIIPNSVTEIEGYAFSGCSGLTSITIPNSVTYIGDHAFEGCSSLPVTDNIRYADTYLVEAVNKELSSYTIKNETKWIGNSAFNGCSSLSSVTIPNNVINIGSNAFQDCTSLTFITIPDSVTSVGYNVFNGCSSLPVTDNIRYADTYLVEVVSKTLSTYTIKNGTKWIGNYAFYGCYSLNSVTIPNNVISIEGWAFLNCHNLSSMTIPNTVTSIGSSAFSGCRTLTSVNIPSNVTNIVYNAFYGCTSVTDVYFNWASEEELQGVTWADANKGNDFAGASSGNTRIHIPRGMASYYEEWAPAWSSCFDEES